MTSGKAVEVVGVPMDLGANIRGANLGPAAIRIAKLHESIKVIGYDVFDEGDIHVPVRETISSQDAKQKYLKVIEEISQKVSARCYQAMDAGRIPLTLGGDHSAAIGSISGVSQWYAEKKKQNIGCIWVDAHADMNTPGSSPSGNIHGMPLSVLLGSGFDSLVSVGGEGRSLKPENTVLIGIRSIDSEEARLCRESGIHYYSMRDIDEKGMVSVIREAMGFAGDSTAGIHLSFDLDGVDPIYAPGVSTPVTGGLSYREAHLMLEMLAESGKLTSMDFVELNPMTDQNHKSAYLMVEFIQSALGKSII